MGMRIGEQMRLRKRGRHEVTIHIRGSGEIRLTNRETGRVRSTGLRLNTLQSGAVARFIEYVSNQRPAGEFPDADAALQLTQSGVVKKLFAGGASIATTTPNHSSPSAAVKWTWNDNTTDVYGPWNDMRFWTVDPGASGLNPLYFSLIGLTSDSKSALEFLEATFTLEAYADSSTGLTDTGLALLLNLFNRSDVTNYLQNSNPTIAKLRPTTTGGVEDPDGDLAAGSLVPDAPNSKITMVFTALDGFYESAWDKTKVKIGSGPILYRYGGCRADGTGCGTKVSGDEWEYTYVNTFAQGS